MTREDIPTRPIKRIMKREHERVGDDAAEQARDRVQAFAERLAKLSADAAEHAGRKTVKADDVAYADDQTTY